MSYIKAFEFEVDPDKVELRFTDGTVLTIDRTAVESAFTNPYELGTLDVLANIDPLCYVSHVLAGDLREYLRTPF